MPTAAEWPARALPLCAYRLVQALEVERVHHKHNVARHRHAAHEVVEVLGDRVPPLEPLAVEAEVLRAGGMRRAAVSVLRWVTLSCGASTGGYGPQLLAVEVPPTNAGP